MFSVMSPAGWGRNNKELEDTSVKKSEKSWVWTLLVLISALSAGGSGYTRNSVRQLAAISCLGYLCLFYVITPRIFENFLLHRGFKMGEKKMLLWYSKVNSTLNAVIVCALALVGLAQDYDALTSDLCLGYSEPIKVAFDLLCGYFVADTFIMLWNYERIGSVTTMIHHVVTAISISMVVLHGTVQYLTMLRVIAELSIPFLNARWFMDTLKVPRSSTIFIANGFLLTFVFGLCRIPIIPYFWWLAIPELLGDNWQRCFMNTFCWCLVWSMVLLDILNIYWFWKMSMSVLKVSRSMQQDNS